MSETTQAPRPFNVVQIFLSRAVMQHRGSPLERPPNEEHHPQQIRVGMGMRDSEDGASSLISVLVESVPDDGDENAFYDFTVEMTALLEDVDRSAFTHKQLLEIVVTMLFPFIRENVANLTMRGRFGPIWLNPFNVRKAIEEAPAAELPVET